MPKQVLAFDVGGTKTAWAIVNDEGSILKKGSFPTPTPEEEFLTALKKVIKAQPAEAIGIGIAGTVSENHRDTVVCANIPELSHVQLVERLHEETSVPIALDNDARCALIGEVWKGAAQVSSSAVLITLGTGVGGAVMQKYKILPHPADINQEISHIVADTSDLLPAKSGKGSIEALIGGRNLEERFGISMAEIAKKGREGDQEAVDLWKTISYYFLQSIQAIHDTYSCKLIIVGGIGSRDLGLYLQEDPPCPVLAAELGEAAGLVGAGRLALDALEDATDTEWV